MPTTHITDLPIATLNGSEVMLVSQLSNTIAISAATISAQASDNSFNDSGSGFITAGFAVGDRVKVSGFTVNNVNNLYTATITALTAGKMTIGGTDGDVIVDEAAGDPIVITKWTSRRVTAGAYRGCAVSMIEKAFTTINNWVPLPFDSEIIDSVSAWDGAEATRLYAPAHASYIRLSLNIRESAVDAFSNNQFAIRKNGSNLGLTDGGFYGEVPSGGYTNGGLSMQSMPISCQPGDYFEFICYLSSSANFSANAEMEVLL